MHSTVDPAVTQVTTGAANTTTNESEVDGQAFLNELEAQLTETKPEEKNADLIALTVERLEGAFPELTISGGTTPTLSEAPMYHLKNGDNGLVTVSEEMLLQMADDEEMFDKVKEMIGGLFAAGSAQNLSPATANQTLRWQSLSIDVKEMRLIEVLRDPNSGSSTVSSLNLDTEEMITQTLDELRSEWNPTFQRLGISSSSTWEFDKILNSSTNWNLELAFSSANQATETLRSSQSFISNIEIVIEEWEASSATKSGQSLLFYMQSAGLSDPLVFDLGGEGINLTSAENGVYFDIKGDGSPVQTAWITGQNAFLYLDENGNGICDDANEMFGDHGGFANGFEKLEQYDSNGDGVIDSNDEIYSQLRLWQDLNGDGVCDDGEYMTLAEAGIASIDLNHDNSKKLDAHGNVIADYSTFTRTDGSTGAVADAWFKTK